MKHNHSSVKITETDVLVVSVFPMFLFFNQILPFIRFNCFSLKNNLTSFKFYEKEIGSNFSNSLLINKSSNTEVSINLCEKSLDMPDFVSDKKNKCTSTFFHIFGCKLIAGP